MYLANECKCLTSDPFGTVAESHNELINVIQTQIMSFTGIQLLQDHHHLNTFIRQILKNTTIGFHAWNVKTQKHNFFTYEIVATQSSQSSQSVSNALFSSNFCETPPSENHCALIGRWTSGLWLVNHFALVSERSLPFT